MEYIKALKTGTAVVLALGFASVAAAGASRSSDATLYLASGGQPHVQNPETEQPPTPEEEAAKQKHKQEEQQTGRHSRTKTPEGTDQQETAPAPAEGTTTTPAQ